MENFERFTVEEAEMFGLPIEHLASSTGRPEDRLGIKLHWPTNNTVSDLAYGDTGSPIPRMIMEEGVPVQGVTWLDTYAHRADNLEKKLRLSKAMPMDYWLPKNRAMHEEFSDRVFELSEAKVWVICGLAKRERCKAIYRGCLVDFRIFLDDVDRPVSVQLDNLHSTVLRIIIWSYHRENLVKRGAPAVGLMLDSAWNLAGALAGFSFDPVYFQQFRKSARSTALTTLTRDAHAVLIGEEPRHFESISENVHLWLQAQNLDSQEALDNWKIHPGETTS